MLLQNVMIILVQRPIQYDLPRGLWIDVICGSVTHHSYHTFLSVHNLQMWSSTSLHEGMYMASYKRMIINICKFERQPSKKLIIQCHVFIHTERKTTHSMHTYKNRINVKYWSELRSSSGASH